MTAEQAIASCLCYSEEQRTLQVDYTKVLAMVKERDRQQFEAGRRQGWKERHEADIHVDPYAAQPASETTHKH